MISTIALIIAATIAIASASCPRYSDIRQPAVAAGRWNNSRWAGACAWYVQATNEPSVPNSTLLKCPCNVYENSVPSLLPFLGPDSYASESVAACGDGVFGFHNLTVKLAGFWNSSAAPAYHFENYAPSSRHPRPRFGPTMIYDAKVVGEDYEWMAVYACEGPPIQKKTGFSWQLLSTQRVVARKDVEDWVGKAAALGLDVDGLEFADWSKCPSWARI